MSDDHTLPSDPCVALSIESRASLGFRSDVDVRVVARTGRMTLIENVEVGASVVPTDRDLVLSGDVQSFPLADLLSLVHASGKSGLLLFECENEQKAIYLSRGEVVFAESNHLVDRLGQCLLRSGLITQDQLELAERHYHPETRFGKVVVELGILTPRDLWNGVKSQVEEIVRSLFSYTSGWIHFLEGEIEPDNVVRLSLPTKRLIGEGLERRDELLRFLARLEDPGARIRVGPETRPPIAENEIAIMAALDEEGEFQALCERSGQIPRAAARSLLFLHLTGRVVVDLDDGSSKSDYTTDDDDEIREAVGLHSKLMNELCAPLVALDGGEAVAERLNRIREESAGDGRSLLAGVQFNAYAAIDPVELERCALGLSGDRMRGIEDALGEIVTYLEFELRNHPQIDDSSPFLEAVEPLRAMLVR
jgi:hypothetical protein